MFNYRNEIVRLIYIGVYKIFGYNGYNYIYIYIQSSDISGYSCNQKRKNFGYTLVTKVTSIKCLTNIILLLVIKSKWKKYFSNKVKFV